MIRAESASLTYSDHGKIVHACDSIDLTVAPGEFVGILGPSGSGKSSLLYMLSGLKTPTSGRVLYESQDLQSLTEADHGRLRLQNFGFVFQHPYLLGYLSALENVLIGRPTAPTTEEAITLLMSLGLADRAHRLPHELSGGERQRVCVARALLGGPKVLFADEPTASLDHANGVQVIGMLDELRGDGALVVVTHDPSMLDRADRIVHLVDGVVQEIIIHGGR